MCLKSLAVEPLRQAQPKPTINPALQKGVGLPMAIFIIVILSFLVVAITQLEQRTGESVSMSVLSSRAFYAAESGAQVALAKLFPPGTDNTCTAVDGDQYQFNQPGLTNCSATINCAVETVAAESYFTITSTGMCGLFEDPVGEGIPADAAQRRVQVRAH